MTSDQERKRQEIIHELVQTEHEYCEDLQFLLDAYKEPLLQSDAIPADKRHEFVQNLFGNIDEVMHVNRAMCDELQAMQSQHSVMPSIADAMLRWSTRLDAYVTYGAQQAVAKHILDEELANNTAFKQFCQVNERKKEARKLPVQSFLSRATTRLGRYPLLLEALMKKSEGLKYNDSDILY